MPKKDDQIFKHHIQIQMRLKRVLGLGQPPVQLVSGAISLGMK